MKREDSPTLFAIHIAGRRLDILKAVIARELHLKAILEWIERKVEQ